MGSNSFLNTLVTPGEAFLLLLSIMECLKLLFLRLLEPASLYYCGEGVLYTLTSRMGEAPLVGTSKSEFLYSRVGGPVYLALVVKVLFWIEGLLSRWISLYVNLLGAWLTSEFKSLSLLLADLRVL